MREIKFRAWDTTSKKMYSQKDIKYYELEQLARFTLTDDPYTKFMQFTGLQDKNGVDIYEGDLLQCGDDRFIMHVIWFDKAQGWRADIMPNRTLSESIFSRERAIGESVKIIGTIHENPELLD